MDDETRRARYIVRMRPRSATKPITCSVRDGGGLVLPWESVGCGAWVRHLVGCIGFVIWTSLVGAAGALGGCGSESERGRSERAEPETRESPGVSAEPSGVSPFPSNAATFAADVEAFVDLAGCQQAIGENVPAALADLLADLGYEQASVDTCIGLEAASTNNPALCDELATHPLQDGCRRRVAAHHQTPEACAKRDDEQDAVCLAWASRRPELCAAAPSQSRALCTSVASNDPSRCDGARNPATCRSVVRRFGRAVGGEAAAAPTPLTSTFEGSVRIGETTLPLQVDLARGVPVAQTGCQYQVRIETSGRPSVSLEFAMVDERWPGTPSVSATFRDARAVIGVPMRMTRHEVTIEAVLGGKLQGSLLGEVDIENQHIEVEITFETFVRTWIDEAACLATVGPL